MSGWSLAKAIAMEKRHILDGGKRVCRQEDLVARLIAEGHDARADAANELLDILRTSLELSKTRLRDLES